jgi:hypothetical protein
MLSSRLQGRTTKAISGHKIMIKKPTAVASPPPVEETETQRFERLLARADFKPLKALFTGLAREVLAMHEALVTTGSYRNFLDKLGYRLVLVKHIHEQDCYGRLGPAGGIRAVLPVHDIATYSTMVTLVNFDSTVSTTPNSVDFYDEQLAQFKVLLMNRSGNAA